MRRHTDRAIILMQDIDRLIAGLFGLIQGMLVSFASMIAPWAVPLAPAAFAAYAVYGTALKQMEPGIAWWVGVATAIGLETVGISAAHTTVDLYNAWRDGQSEKLKVFVGAGLVVAYFFAGIGVILLLEGTPPAVKVVGTGAFVLALISYIGQVLRTDVRRIARGSQQEQKLADLELDFQHQKELQQSGQQHELAIKRAELNAHAKVERARLAQSQQEPNLSQLSERLDLALSQLDRQGENNGKPAHASMVTCGDCGREDFSSVQGLNAHKRFCKDGSQRAT